MARLALTTLGVLVVLVTACGALAIRLTDEGEGLPMFALLLAMNSCTVALAGLAGYLLRTASLRTE